MILKTHFGTFFLCHLVNPPDQIHLKNHTGEFPCFITVTLTNHYWPFSKVCNNFLDWFPSVYSRWPLISVHATVVKIHLQTHETCLRWLIYYNEHNDTVCQMNWLMFFIFMLWLRSKQKLLWDLRHLRPEGIWAATFSRQESTSSYDNFKNFCICFYFVGLISLIKRDVQ